MWSQPAAPVVDPALRRRRLGRRDAWRLMRGHQEGRLHFLSGRGPRSVVVPYATTDTAVVIELPAYNDALPYLEGRVVSIEVSDHDPDGHQWSVEISGLSRPTPSDPGDEEVSDVIRQWPSALVSRRFLIPTDHVSGSISGDLSPATR